VRTFTNTATDTENNRIPNWNAKKVSRGVSKVRDSPVIKIKSLGDTTNNPASTNSLTDWTVSQLPGK
jgi:hypothetical protein